MSNSKTPKVRKRKVTQSLIAQEAGVSQTLVSLVLNNASAPDRVAEDTRARILKTALKLGYQIRGGSGRKRTLALILPLVSRVENLDARIYDSLEDFYARTQKYVAEAAYRKGYALVVRYYEEPTELTHWLTEWDVDGVLWQASDEKLLDWIARRFPVAQLHYGGGAVAPIPVDTVTADQEQIPVLALRHLAERSHKRICFAYGYRDSKVTRIRMAALAEEAAARDIVIFQPESDALSTWDMIRDCLRLMERPEEERPTAFILGDPGALALARELQKRGYQIPRDCSLVGIDDISAMGLYNPPLTSIDVCQKEVSETAVEMLVARLANPDSRHQRIFISPKIVERESVGAAPASRAHAARV